MKKMPKSTPKATHKQIGRLLDYLRFAAQDSELTFDEARRILELEKSHIVNDFSEVIKKYRKILDMENVVRMMIMIDRNKTQEEFLRDIEIDTCVGDPALIGPMPTTEERKLKVFFFQIQIGSRTHINDEDLAKEYQLRNLKPVDPFALIQANLDDLSLHEAKPNATHWKNEKGIWFAASFDPTGNGPVLKIHQHVVPWNTRTRWFAGVRA